MAIVDQVLVAPHATRCKQVLRVCALVHCLRGGGSEQLCKEKVGCTQALLGRNKVCRRATTARGTGVDQASCAGSHVGLPT